MNVIHISIIDIFVKGMCGEVSLEPLKYINAYHK